MAFRHKDDIGKEWFPQPKPEKIEKKYAGIAKMSAKTLAKKDEKKAEAIELFKYCQAWYDGLFHKKCFECSGAVPVYSKLNGHHIIARRFQDRYNIDLSLNSDNMVLLCRTCHSKVEVNIDHAPKTKELTEIVYKRFEKNLL